jgi:hypothetical protein
MRLGGGSLRLDGSRSLYNEIWKAKVPPKVRVFAWKLSQDGWAKQSNKHRRTLTKDAICQLCGKEDGTGYPTVVRCTKPTTLRHVMRRHCMLPDEEAIRYTGPDWSLVLLSSLSEESLRPAPYSCYGAPGT